MFPNKECFLTISLPYDNIISIYYIVLFSVITGLCYTQEDASQDIVTKAREAGDKLKHKLEKDGKDQYDNMLNKAKGQINAEKQKALNEIKNTVVEIALQASEKVIKRNLNDADNQKMIEETVEKFKQAN